MPKSPKQIMKLIILEKILTEKTDETHTLSVKQIMQELERYGISSERKSIYSDIEILRDFGMDIICITGACNKYYLASRLFEIAELKLLADAVSSSKFITEKKSIKLIEKISQLTSESHAKEIRRQVYVQGRVKSENEKVFYNIDALQNAISEHKKITFKYFDFTANKDKRKIPIKKYRDDGKERIVTPCALIWDNENYYLNGYYEAKNRQSNFRVDKMEKVTILDSEADERCISFDVETYSKKVFGMYTGKEIHVRILVDDRIIGTFYDKFGLDLHTNINNIEGYTEIATDIEISPPFIGWIFQFGDMIKIIEPQELINEIKDCALSVIDNL